MKLLAHLRQRRRLAALASGVLDERAREATLRHAASCDRCRSELADLTAALELVKSDPLREASPPLLVGVLLARVQGALDEATSGSRPAPAWRWALPTAGAALAAATLLAVVLPQRPPAAGPRVEMSEEVMERLERNLVREHAARYLSEAGDVLVSVGAAPVDCDREDERVDVSLVRDRSQELLARRTLLLEPERADVASARVVLDDVEQALREVAALDACVRRQDVERLRDQVGRRRLLMRIRLMAQELEG